jgi:hypothetical protein
MVPGRLAPLTSTGVPRGREPARQPSVSVLPPVPEQCAAWRCRCGCVGEDEVAVHWAPSGRFCTPGGMVAPAAWSAAAGAALAIAPARPTAPRRWRQQRAGCRSRGQGGAAGAARSPCQRRCPFPRALSCVSARRRAARSAAGAGGPAGGDPVQPGPTQRPTRPAPRRRAGPRGGPAGARSRPRRRPGRSGPDQVVRRDRELIGQAESLQARQRTTRSAFGVSGRSASACARWWTRSPGCPRARRPRRTSSGSPAAAAAPAGGSPPQQVVAAGSSRIRRG